MEVIIYTVVGQLAVVGLLFKWLHVQARDNKIALGKVYDKEETKEVIDLKLAPINLGIGHVQKDLAELKHMVGRLLDEKNKS